MLTMTREKLTEIADKYRHLLLAPEDAGDALCFAWEVVCAEYDAVKAKRPMAIATLNKLDKMEHALYEIYSDIENGKFEEF